MSKTKSTTKVTKPSKSDVLTKVKDAAVAKSSKDSKPKSKEVAKKVAEKEGKKSKKDKKVKEPTPEPSSEDSSDSESSASESEVKAKKAVVSSKAGKKAAPKDESDESSSSEEEVPAPKKAADKKTVTSKTNGAKPAAKKDESDSDSSDSSDADVTPATGVLGAAPAVDDASDDSSDESASSADEAVAKPAAKAAKAEASGDSSDESDSDSSADEKPAAKANKRKAEDDAEPTAKKAKTDGGEADNAGGNKNLFVGNLSWNIDENWLRQTFEEHGELTGVRVMYDKATQRAKGFGYVEFANAADAAKAYDAKKGFELDGRAMNVDWASVKPDNKDQQADRRKSYGDQLSEPSDTIFVGNLSFDAGQEQVSESFSPFGTILSVRLPTDPNSGGPKGFGYVTFSTVDEAKGALEGMQGGYIASRPVRLDYSQPRPERTDGGFGGRGRGGDRGRGGFGGRGRGGDRGRGGFGGRGRGGDRGGRGGRGGSTNRGGFGDFQGKRQTFD